MSDIIDKLADYVFDHYHESIRNKVFNDRHGSILNKRCISVARYVYNSSYIDKKLAVRNVIEYLTFCGVGLHGGYLVNTVAFTDKLNSFIRSSIDRKDVITRSTINILKKKYANANDITIDLLYRLYASKQLYFESLDQRMNYYNIISMKLKAYLEKNKAWLK